MARPKGSVNRTTAARLAIVRRAEKAGITPLEVMLDIMRRYYRDEKWPEALGAAKEAAPYIHPKLATIQQKQDLQVTIKDEAAMTPAAHEIEGVYEAAREHGVTIDQEGNKE